MVSIKKDENGFLNINIRIDLENLKDLNILEGEEIMYLRGYPLTFLKVVEKLFRIFGSYDLKTMTGYVEGGPDSKAYEVIIREI
ncbi:MAG: hypothetical protein PHW52_04240 [Candidatus Pacebacteria bacterium]|nr:hypothetical protein [Candidatus Paceibacterota bacterium]